MKSYIKESASAPGSSNHSRVAIMVATSLLTTFLLSLAISISAEPVLERNFLKSPLTKRYNVMERDLNRASIHRRQSDGNNISPAISHGPGYIVTVGVGSPPTFCK